MKQYLTFIIGGWKQSSKRIKKNEGQVAFFDIVLDTRINFFNEGRAWAGTFWETKKKCLSTQKIKKQ